MIKTLLIYGCVVTASAGNFIKNEEGIRLHKYRDAGGYSIGYGHFIKPGEHLNEISIETANKLLYKDMKEFNKVLTKVSPVPLTRGQCTALQSFVYNVGPNRFKQSSVYKNLIVGRLKTAGTAMGKYIYSRGKVLKGLKARRSREMKLFFSGK